MTGDTRDPGRVRLCAVARGEGDAPPPKKVLTALGKVFAAEIDGLLPFQSKASIYRDLLAAGLVSWMERKYGTGVFAVTVSGYELTHRGRHLYCASCDDTEAP